ncbi:MAG: hypothetical protein LBU04_05420 [Christensenellaceae bacterium]|jgi:hypothetical protein|nr:hypothetical protein [Christensenellaceae bacterium]
MRKKLTKKDELMREAGLLISQLAQADGIKTIDGIQINSWVDEANSGENT